MDYFEMQLFSLDCLGELMMDWGLERSVESSRASGMRALDTAVFYSVFISGFSMNFWSGWFFCLGVIFI